jgi:rare lipoprotein A
MRIFLMAIFTVMVASISQASAQSGMASYYWQPQRVACGGKFNPNAMTAAHKTLPCGTRVTVTNKRNGKSVVVTINDRGPFVRGRIIDVSLAAARQLGMTGAGVVPVTVTKN